MNLKTTKSNNGITLIALIITIIVLLILAVVSIGAIRDGGIITHAESAKSEYQAEQEKEKVTLAVSEAMMANNGGEITKANLVNALNNQFGAGNYNITGEEAPFTVTVVNGTGTVYTIEANGNVTTDKNNQSVGRWTQTEDGITDGEVTLQIGDYVDYDPTKDADGNTVAVQSYTSYSAANASADKNDGRTSGYTSDQTFSVNTTTNGWRVLGIENGEIQLISADPISKNSGTTYYLSGEKGYLNSEEELNAICSIYGQGEGATGARSLKVEDINKLANYDPTTYSGYGDIWTYRFPTSGEYMQYKRTGSTNVDWTNITNTNYQTFRLPGETNIISSSNRNDNGISLETTYYYYNISTYVTQIASDGKKISDIITKGNGSSIRGQWLASRCIQCSSHGAAFFVNWMDYGSVGERYRTLYNSNGSNSSGYCYIRPVISLKSDIQLSGSSERGWTIQ